ncbi:redox-regulated ATPase YchF [Candidatus Woesearchaeota archaeon]|nr:redox-regulated ATPase YchF [Candidatus Woesearchaeota archaeon]
MLIGIVGKANVGKSTFFKAATLAEVEIANYPFATIKPNSGVGYVQLDCVDKDFNVNCNPREGFCIDHVRFVPVQLIDVAGLVPGAHEGKGMGNQFLDDLRQADVLVHVIDVSGSTNEKGEPIEVGSYDPSKDIKFLEVELDMWYLRILKKGWEKFARQVMQEKQKVHKELGKQLSGLKVTEDMVGEVINFIGLDSEKVIKWSDEDLEKIAVELRKRTKPMIIAANKIDIKGAKENFDRLKKDFPDLMIVPCSAESELALREASKHELIKYIPGKNDFEILNETKLNDQQKNALNFVKENILDEYTSTGIQPVLDKAVFELLKYIAIFPGGMKKLEDQHGNTLPDCFLIPDGSTALDFAFKIHTDLGKNFIKAVDVKAKQIVGKNHKLKNRDVVEIITSR